MKTKTPDQIFKQWQRMAKLAKTKTNIERLKRATITSRRYWDNIYRANGITDRHKCNDTAKCNWLWYNAATPKIIYAKI